jgi:hypothetical protein
MTAVAEPVPTLTMQQAYALHLSPTITAHAASMLEAYNLALSPGMQRNPARCATPRQIADDVIECLAELTTGIPALCRVYEELREAYLLLRPIPPGPVLQGEWPDIEATVQGAFDVRDALRAGNVAAAWRAAAAATFRYRDAEDRLRLELRRKQAKAAAEQRIADGREKGAEKNRAQRDARRQRAIDIYRSRTWTKDGAATEIAEQLGVTFITARGYLRGVSTS